jgi:hypothetical protein
LALRSLPAYTLQCTLFVIIFISLGASCCPSNKEMAIGMPVSV